ncbi:MAG TPA: MlaD family protein [Chryseosolibacter sp.]|nr:MlaD family protein [Chryseosolibacter sp.]
MQVSKEVKVGLFMIISIVLLYFGFSFLKGVDFFSSENKYYAIYKNIDKLTESNLIYLNGYSVGRVSNIQIQQDKNRVIVELSINSKIKLNQSTVAVLNGELLGGRFIHLSIGNNPDALRPKDTIRSDVAKGLAELITESAEPVAANLQSTLQKMNSMLDTLNTSASKINLILTDLRATPRLLNSTISSVKGNIGQLSGTYQTVGSNLNTTLNELKPTLENFRRLSDSLKRIEIAGTMSKAQQTLARLNETLTRFNSGDNTMSKLMTEDSLYLNLNTLLNNLDSLANHLNSNPKHFMAPFGKSRRKIEKELEEQRKENGQ